MKNNFKITYDKEADAMYISLKKGKINHTKEVSNLVFVDVDSKNKPLGIEIVDVFSRFGKKILKKDGAKNKIGSIPVEFISKIPSLV